MNKQQGQSSIWRDRMAVLLQYCMPHHALSLVIHQLARSEIVWFKQWTIKFVIARYNINIDEAAQPDIATFSSFNTFFTRQLRQGIRPVAGGCATLVSPVDGMVSQIGTLKEGRVVQAKGHCYTVRDLLAGDEVLADQFKQGQFTTLYLSPRDYHRIHMPFAGQLQQMQYVPGRLFSVTPRNASVIPNLFARNERVITVFATDHGPIILVLVGAIFVGSMETVWAGQITPPYSKTIKRWCYDDSKAPVLQKGEEMGRFNMGSTVVMLLTDQAGKLRDDLTPGTIIKMGQAMTD